MKNNDKLVYVEQ